MSTRSLSSALGVVLIVVGFAMLFVPGLSGLFPTNELYLSLVGVGFALQTVPVVRGRLKNPYEQDETDDPEITQELPTPGEEFDELLEEAGAARHSAAQRDTVRERLRAAAVAVVVRSEGVSREGARAKLEDGSWTDDPYAAAFFTGRVEHSSFLGRVSLFDRTRSQYERWAKHAANEVVRLNEEADA